MHVKLKFGDSTREIVFPDQLDVDVLKPATLPEISDTAEKLRQSLGSSAGGEGFQDVHPRSVAIAVPDETRPFPVRELLPVLLEHLFRLWPHLNTSDITVLVGGGLHPPMDEPGLARLIPSAVRRGVRVLAHDARNDPMLDLGLTSRGTPVSINKGFASAELRIVMGQIDPHQFVGFTGGSKGACIGLASAETIRSNHSLLFEPGAEVGSLENNPVREDLNEAGDLLGIHLAVNVVVDPHKRPVWLGAGNPRDILRAGSQVCSQVYGVLIEEPYDLVVASCGGSPKDICLYQAQKGLNLASVAARPGGRIVLLAACEQGVGDADYYEYVCRFCSIEETLADFQAREFCMGAHKAYLFGRSLVDFEVVVDSLLDTGVLSHCHLKSGNAQETIDRWVREGPSDLRVAVVPNANTTFFQQGSRQRVQHINAQTSKEATE